MSSLWNRLNTMISANNHAALDRVENPAHMSRHILREVDADLGTLRASLVVALGRQRQLTEAQQKLAQQNRAQKDKATHALQHGDEAQARHHLNLHLKLAQECAQLEALLSRQEADLVTLRAERASLLREREELSSAARVIQLRHAVLDGNVASDGDLYGKVMHRRERMQTYQHAVDGRSHELAAAQQLRQEELGSLETPDDADLDAALSALKLELTHTEHAA